MKKAFTMIELIFVIVIIGILSAILAPNFRSNSLQEATNQIISHIRYTQHLALNDDKFSNSDFTWYEKRWQIQFSDNSNGGTNKNWKYVIFSDLTKNGNANKREEVAKNPENPNLDLVGWSTSGMKETKKLNIEKSFGITSVSLSGGCKGLRISFDNLGRPFEGLPTSHTSAYQANKLITTQCQVILTGADGSTNTIAIEPETGYVHQL